MAILGYLYNEDADLEIKRSSNITGEDGYDIYDRGYTARVVGVGTGFILYNGRVNTHIACYCHCRCTCTNYKRPESSLTPHAARAVPSKGKCRQDVKVRGFRKRIEYLAQAE